MRHREAWPHMTPTAPTSVQIGIGEGLVLPPGAFRLLLAFAVVISHISRLDVGHLAVLLFFYLSGYWVALIWQAKFGRGSIVRFYAARYLRIAPLYLLAVWAAALLRGQPIHVENLTLFGVASTHRDPTGVAWSLDIELQFYVLVPFLVAAIAASPVWLSAILLLAISASGYWLAAHTGMATIAIYLPAFALGTLTYVKAWRPSLRTAHISLAGFVAMTALTALTPFLDKSTPDPFNQDIWGLIWMLPLVPYVARSLTVRSTSLDRDLGNLSYPLYLVHFTAITLALSRFGDTSAVKLAAVAVSVGVAAAVYFLIDRQVDSWRVRLTETPKKLAPEATLL